MLEYKVWKSYVKMRRKHSPETNCGRTVKILDINTMRGQEIARRAWQCEAYALTGIYDNPSPAKQSFYEDVYKMYIYDEGENFHICSHNSFQFTVAWDKIGEVVYITRDTEYHVLFND